MKKKIILALLMAALLAGGAFAQFNMSAGLGGNFGMHMTSYSGEGDKPKPLVGGGFYAFYDATYAMAKVGMFIGGKKMDMSFLGSDDSTVNMSYTYFSLGLLGKYPIDLGSFTLFPMVGFEYNLFMRGKMGSTTFTRAGINSDDPDDLISSLLALFLGANDMFIIQAGAGADFNITDNIYLRPSLLWGIDLYRSAFEKLAGGSIFKHKLDVGIAVGYKF